MSRMHMRCCCFGSSRRGSSEQDADGYMSAKNIKLFSYNEISSATKNFHASNRIGRGGFGTVYKIFWFHLAYMAQILNYPRNFDYLDYDTQIQYGYYLMLKYRTPGTLKNGTQVAVKSLSTESKQGIREFLTEIDIISNISHPNLVELIGCCIEGENRALIYEYVENGSLDRALLGSKRIRLDWDTRSNICMGTARGLAYLHEELDPCIVHRDIKVSNILLDGNLAPKIGDFGLAKLFPDNVTHLSTRIAGTVGYLAPEYAMRGQLTKKADIYSFGVLILEIISGRSSGKSITSGAQKYLLEWAWQLYQEGRLVELVDPELGQYPEEEVIRYSKVALFCTQGSAQRRPSITQVIDMLSKHSRLNEKLLTPPGIIQDLVKIGEGLKTTSSSNSPALPLSADYNLPNVDSTDPFSSGPSTFSEMTPR
ncbi:cold-responsive protein kinase 1-like isoform X1 [Tasmannia lanceolata]|uniref:cold-responsive protein kinase 1-like isoform X1 n=1 Tax=Tasmannia lanceolata TaxID=3420 RepID=UPI0040641625